MIAWAIRHDGHGVHLDTLCFLPEGDKPESRAEWQRLPWLDEPDQDVHHRLERYGRRIAALVDQVARLEKAQPAPSENTTGYPTYEAALQAKEARIAELEGTCAVYWVQREHNETEIEQLKKRQTELLETIKRLSNETPFPEEAQDALAQRGKLLAEIGTQKAEVTRLRELLETEREHHAVQSLPDLDLLRKFATGEGGRRTGDLMRRGLISEIELTKRGWAAICEEPVLEGDHSFEDVCEDCGQHRINGPCSVCPHLGSGSAAEHYARLPCEACGSTKLHSVRVRPPLTARTS